MTQGSVEQEIIKQATRNRQPLPEAIRNAPELYYGLDLYFRAFIDLNTCRHLGTERGPIPWTALLTYADHINVTGEDKEVFLYLLQKMDDGYLTWSKAERDKKKSQGKNSRR